MDMEMDMRSADAAQPSKEDPGTPPSTPPSDPEWCGEAGAQAPQAHGEAQTAQTHPATSVADLRASDAGEHSDTIILLDWDDTLLPSTMLTQLGYRVDEKTPLPADLAGDLTGLAEDVIRLLDTCQQYGTVLLVTNAETGWVELSSERFMPTVITDIRQRGIKVVSARSAYDGPFPNSPVDWKQVAFVSEVGQLCDTAEPVNLVSIGDSLNERTAAHHVGGKYDSGSIKTVKFVERPDIDQIRRQLSLIASNLGDIATHDGSFDVNLVC